MYKFPWLILPMRLSILSAREAGGMGQPSLEQSAAGCTGQGRFPETRPSPVQTRSHSARRTMGEPKVHMLWVRPPGFTSLLAADCDFGHGDFILWCSVRLFSWTMGGDEDYLGGLNGVFHNSRDFPSSFLLYSNISENYNLCDNKPLSQFNW